MKSWKGKVNSMNKFAFLFPGQGTQFIQMGKSFYDQYMIARQTFEEASTSTGQDIAQLCFKGTFSQINQFTNMQIAIVTTETAISFVYGRLWDSAPISYWT